MARGKVLNTVIQISGEISPTLGKSLDDVSKRMEGIDVKGLAVGASIGGIAIATGLAVFKAGKALVELGDEYNMAVNNIAAGTGATGAVLDGLGESIKQVYADNFGGSMDDVSAGLAQVYKDTGLVGDQLEATTEGAFALRDTFGYDMTESSRAAKAMMTNFGIEGEAAMSMIAAGAQNGLDYSGELIDSVNEYSVQFAKLGFSADDMFNIFQEGADSGAWNLDKVGDAIKEFSIRSIDGSKTTTDAFLKLGYNADTMMATFAAGGEGANTAFGDVVNKLMFMDDQVLRDQVGVELFGTQWEDLGTDAIKAMADMQSGAYDTGEALQKINDVKYDNLGSAFQAIKRQGEVALLPLASSLANAFTDMAPTIGKIFETLGPMIADTTEQIMPFVDEFLTGMTELLPEIIPLITDLAGSLLPVLAQFIGSLLPPLLSLIKQILPPIMQIVQAVLPPLMSILTSVLPVITQIASTVMPVLVSVINALLPIITTLMNVGIEMWKGVIEPLLPPLMQIVEAILPLITSMLTPILPLIKAISPILSAIGSALGTIVGWVAKVVEWVASGLGWVADLVTGKAKAGKSPDNFATGGFTNGVSIAGEDPRYPTEAVISFNPAYRTQNLSYWAQAGRMLGAGTTGYTLSGASGGTSINLGGISFAPKIVVSGNADKESIMEAIEDEYPEFIDLLESWFAKRGVGTYVK